MNWSLWLLGLAKPLLSRVLAALGMGILTIAGWEATIGALDTLVTNSLGGLPSAIAALCGIAGIDRAFGIILGAIAARWTLATLTASVKITGAPS